MDKYIDILKRSKILFEKKGHYYVKLDSFDKFKINKIFIDKIDDEFVLMLESNNIRFEYWISQNKLIPPWQTHWFQLKNETLLKISGCLLNDLFKRAIKKSGSICSLSKSLKLSTPSFYYFIHNKIRMISVRKLRRLLSYLKIPYVNFDDKIEFTKKGFIISIKSPKFPINLNSKYGALILGSIVSDGCIYMDKKARNAIRTKYSTNEQDSVRIFANSVNKIYGDVHLQKEFARNCMMVRIGSSIVGETLLKAGAILGQKARVNGEVPWMIRLGSLELKRYYLKSVFSDEASIYVGKKTYSSYIILSRYRHLNNINDKHLKDLIRLERYMSSRKFPTGHVNKTITIKKASELLTDKSLVDFFNSPPNLLLGESDILNQLGIRNRLWARSLNKTHLGNYSLCFDLFINKKESMLKFYREIGFLIKKKQEKLINVVKNLNY